MPQIIFPAQKLSLQAVELPWLHQNKVHLAVLRADLIDPLLSGNKFFKLKYNLKMATEQGKSTLLSFGGLGQTIYMPWLRLDNASGLLQ